MTFKIRVPVTSYEFKSCLLRRHPNKSLSSPSQCQIPGQLDVHTLEEVTRRTILMHRRCRTIYKKCLLSITMIQTSLHFHIIKTLKTLFQNLPIKTFSLPTLKTTHTSWQCYHQNPLLRGMSFQQNASCSKNTTELINHIVKTLIKYEFSFQCCSQRCS